ncbi:MAG TPA: hypothetical protein VGL86_03390 [Polyangia bacterium]
MEQHGSHFRFGFAVAFSLWVFFVAAADSSFAYVRTTTETSDVPVQWNEGCVVVTPDLRGSKDIAIDQVNDVLERATVNWTKLTSTCGGLVLTSRPAYKVLDVAADGIPALIFRNDAWQRPGHPPHDPAAIGLTTVMYVNTPGAAGDGSILDADIELNNVNYTFVIEPSTMDARPGTQIADLENTITHELGHVQGLAHTCWDHITDTPPLDNMGNPIPDCNDSDLPPFVTDATMYPYATMEGETSKRNLTPDDVSGVCDVYQPLAGKLSCYPEIDGGACSAAPSGRQARLPGALVVVIAMFAGAHVARRRRCSRS